MSSKNFITAESSHEGEFRYVNDHDAPSALRPVPRRECVTPELGDAGNCFVPVLAQLGNEALTRTVHCRTITTIFMMPPLFSVYLHSVSSVKRTNTVLKVLVSRLIVHVELADSHLTRIPFIKADPVASVPVSVVTSDQGEILYFEIREARR